MSKFGASLNLSVPTLQELAKEPITKVPEQYLRPNLDTQTDTTSLPQVPIIDLSKLVSGDVDELEKLDHACKEWGFFQLINHGVNYFSVENMKISVQEFFNLPIEEKKPFWLTPEDLEGFVGHHVFDEQKLDWVDPFFIYTLPLNKRNPRLFNSFPHPLRINLENYSLEMEKLCITIIEYMTIALKIKRNEVQELFENSLQTMRWNYYPPCPQPENVIGLDSHSDGGGIAILLQANEIEGLQVKKDGKWIPIKPISNAFSIVLGDTLEIITNGVYRSVEHRAIVNSEKERISIVAFHRPQQNKVIGPIPSLVTTERPALFKQIVAGDYYKIYFSRKPQGKTCLDVMRIKNDIGE
ncbi:protein SRG1 [Cajanus cajan]|uniref:Protein SRG1 n=1 Tax=Cajanus cajan TaxID=3821 RepID=A0A151R5D8_CAJCA|nr:protein SRG1 [Cajanus cajan]XP_029125381.1 protein SRG1 [Cajanus cajan]KYP37742.1 Protein SRG1 [Cajanus cajan]